MKLDSGGGAEHNMSEPLVNSPETKRLMEIAVAQGASVRAVHNREKALANRGTSTGLVCWCPVRL